MADCPACIHCGRPIHNTDNATWWDINEVAGWLCHRSKSYNSITVYRKIRERLRKGLIDVSNHVPPPPNDDDAKVQSPDPF